jgi:hypothetical protein
MGKREIRAAKFAAEREAREIAWLELNLVKHVRIAIAYVRTTLIPQREAFLQGKYFCFRCRKPVEWASRDDGWCRPCSYTANKKARLRWEAKPGNKEKKLKSIKKHTYMRLKTDYMFLLKTRIRDRISKALRLYAKGYHKTGSGLRYLGCSAPQLHSYLTPMLKRGMTWNNYGSMWHVDHVIPLASFNLLDEGDRAKAFHYTNLQPLMAIDNIRKGDTIPTRAHQPWLLL